MGTIVDPSVESADDLAPTTATSAMQARPEIALLADIETELDAADAPPGALKPLSIASLDDEPIPPQTMEPTAEALPLQDNSERTPPGLEMTAIETAAEDDAPAVGSLGPMKEVASEASVGSMPSGRPGFQRTGHPVRDRLLARAELAPAVQPRAKDTFDELDPFSGLQEVANELNEIAVPRRARSSYTAGGATGLSPSAVMLTGTLVGAAVITCTFALLSQFAPRNVTEAVHEPAATPAPTEASPATSTSATSQAPSKGPKQEGPWRITRASTGQQLIKGTIGRAAFLSAIQEAGLSKTHAYQAYNALKEVANLDHCRPSNEFVALIDRNASELLAFEYIAGKEEIYQARRDKSGVLAGKALDLKVERTRVQGAFMITTDSFSASLAGSNLDPSIGRAINKALDGHTSVEQFRLGDRVRVIAQQVTVLGQFARYGGIEALEYVPANGAPLRVYYNSSKRKYYDAKGRAPGEGGWRKPIKGAPITSKFNPNRMHPILKKRMPHNGTDFGVPTGTPIHASSYGVISKLGPLGPNGNFVGIEHANGYETGYSHLSRFEPGLKVGDKVESLQVIGYVGSTGSSTGPHLHFSAKKKGVFIDPESLNLDALTVLPSSERGAFEELRRSYDTQLDAVALPPPMAAPPPTPTAHEDIDQETGEPIPAPTAQGPANAGAPPVTASTPAVTPPPGAAPNPTPPANPPPAKRAGSLYLSDRELTETQGAADDGEVDE